ncbi:hypothetical protein SAMD00019534_047130 [Acytostelium subglobosum LB1]|uniref:hypothetical protein n=1 Tax=Acytostelium subglobosum LB1 TaxID=1410327 RepID=UPI0006448BF3|nr:hypothetical protein SAMD00019534_047130 [Acytostelium subglobosum LB1]GAM21538.1 hypothetical protein SAMD00019534_047130 [Acytostelium subglobosum LB1]|eukprot:XP_012755657.1 hypothetical protein SAMD00019534_047130 [Acytostelium subglobosum LB1]
MEAFQKIHPLEFYRKFLERDVRPDGRSLTTLRKTTVATGSILTADGSSFVKIGNTSIICGVRAEVAEYQINNSNNNNNGNSNGKDNKGGNTSTSDATTTSTTTSQRYCKDQIFVNVELGPICSNIFSSSKPSEKAMTLCSQMNRLANLLEIEQSELNFDSEGRFRWYLYVDLYCLDYNGNILDAAIIAMLTALKNVRLPRGIVEDGEPLRDCDSMRVLNVPTYFSPLTFALIDDYVLSDPSLEEEKLASGSITLVYNQHGDICLSVVSSTASINDNTLQQCRDKTKERIKDVIDLIDQSCTVQSIV